MKALYAMLLTVSVFGILYIALIGSGYYGKSSPELLYTCLFADVVFLTGVFFSIIQLFAKD